MLTGVGFTAQGFDCSIPYTRSEGARQKPFSTCTLRIIPYSKVTWTVSRESRVRLQCGFTVVDSAKTSRGLFCPESTDPRAAFVFAGTDVDVGKEFGDDGLVLG